jgi:hypothetical protein
VTDQGPHPSSDDPRERPAYTLAEAAFFLAIPYSTLRSWCLGDPARTDTSPALVRPASATRPELSFHNIVELHVLAALRREHGFSMQHLRKALDHLQHKLGHDRPLLSARLATDGVSLFVDDANGIESLSTPGQLGLAGVLTAHLSRIERDAEGGVARLYLFTRGNASDPRLVVIDPAVAEGQPVLAGTALTIQGLAARLEAGEPFPALAAAAGRPVHELAEALGPVLRPEVRSLLRSIA